MEKTEKKMPLAVQILIPLFLTLLCSGIILLCAVRPFEMVKTYLRIGFMDSNQTIPQGTGTAGLNIVEADIDTEYQGETNETGNITVSAYGSQCAVLTCEALDMYVPVYWGGGAELLEKGACQTPASVPIGENGNSVISAHVNTFFHNLSDIQVGDTVVLHTDYGRFTYEVTKLIEFDASNEQYIKNTSDNRLTLYTCKMELLGSSSERIGAICRLAKSEFYSSEEVLTDE